MLKLRIDWVELEFQPTADGYHREVVPLGSWRRALDGTLHGRVAAVKKRWTLDGYFGGQRELILSLPRRGAFRLLDIDGVERDVMCVSALPHDLLGAYSLGLEEV